MADVTLWGASYSDVPAITVPKTGGGTVTFYENGGGTPAISVVDTTDTAGGTIRTITALDISDTTAVASDVASGKYFYTAAGVKTAGTGSGGGGGATEHTIHLEFSDSTDTDISVYYDNSLLGTMITAYAPSTWTYNNKTVYVGQLDNVTFYDVTPSPETWETLYNATTGFNSGDTYPYCWITELGDIQPTIGSVWRISLDGVAYRLTAKATGLTTHLEIGLGNPLYVDSTDDGTDVPFCIGYYGYGAWSGSADVTPDTSHQLKVERLVTA